MKPSKLTCSCLVAIAWVATSANGESLRTDINPALRYYQAFLVAPDISESNFDYLATNYWWSQSLPQKYGELVARYDAEFKLIRLASSASVACDWGIDTSEGPATLLPALARCKAVMLGARYRVAWHLQHQRQAEAREDLLAAFALARNISRDGTLISVLVQIASEAIGCDTIAENFGRFTPESFQQLIEGIDAAPARGTVAASMAFEKASFHDWLLNRVLELQNANPGDDAKVLARIHESLSVLDAHEEELQQPPFWEQLLNAAGHTSQGIVELLQEQGHAYDRLAAVMALPYSEFDGQAKQLAAEFQRSPNPLIAQALQATILRARQREFKIQVWLAMLHTAAAYKSHGDPGLLSVADPCGQGPFSFQRFSLDGVDRGFQLKSAYEGSGFPEALIFVEKPGTPFFPDGPHIGEARSIPNKQK